MKAWKLKLAALLSVFLLLFATSEVTYHVFTGNQEQGLYPADADSISIPFITGEIVAFFVFVFTFIGVLLPNSKVFGLIGIAFLGLASLLTLSSAAEWMIPNHYWISVAYLIEFVSLLLLLIASFHLRRNLLRSLKPELTNKKYMI